MATTTSASNYLEDKLLDLVFRGVTYSPPSNVYVQRYSVAPSDSGGGTPEGDRVVASFDSASGLSAATDADLTFTAATGNTVAVGIHDASTSGNLLFWGELATPIDPDGEDLIFAAGDLTVAFARTGSTGISDDLAAALLDHVLRSESYTPATDIEVGLFDGSGDEVSGGSYAAQVVAFEASSGGEVENSDAEAWTNLPAVTVAQLRAFEDAGSGGMHLWSWAITPQAFTSGGSATLAVGALTASID